MKFLSALCLLFVGLKLTNYISWSWWFVMAPIYPIILYWVLLAVAGLAMVDLVVKEYAEIAKQTKR